MRANEKPSSDKGKDGGGRRKRTPKLLGDKLQKFIARAKLQAGFRARIKTLSEQEGENKAELLEDIETYGKAIPSDYEGKNHHTIVVQDGNNIITASKKFVGGYQLVGDAQKILKKKLTKEQFERIVKTKTETFVDETALNQMVETFEIEDDEMMDSLYEVKKGYFKTEVKVKKAK